MIVAHTTAGLLPGGQLGVDVFFALSGFLITSILLREHSRFGTISLKAFYARRFLRLTPALLVFLVGATAVALVYDDPHAWIDLLVSATYTSNFYFAFNPLRGSFTAHSWSLATEEQFYLLWPITLVMLLRWRRNTMIWMVAGAIAAFIALTAVLQAAGAPTLMLYEIPTTRAPELLVGALGAIGWHYGLPSGLARGLRSTAVGGLALAAVVAWMFHDTWADPWSFRGGFVVVASLTVVIVLHVIQRPDGVINALLSLPPAVWIGRRSYGMYLWHIPVMVVVAEVVPGGKAHLVVTFAATALVANLSWHLVERPALRRKTRFERVQLAGDDPAPVATSA